MAKKICKNIVEKTVENDEGTGGEKMTKNRQENCKKLAKRTN